MSHPSLPSVASARVLNRLASARRLGRVCAAAAKRASTKTKDGLLLLIVARASMTCLRHVVLGCREGTLAALKRTAEGAPGALVTAACALLAERPEPLCEADEEALSGARTEALDVLWQLLEVEDDPDVALTRAVPSNVAPVVTRSLAALSLIHI